MANKSVREVTFIAFSNINMDAEDILTETLPVLGKVPLVFYIPECPELPDLEIMIRHNGGITTEIHECFTF